MRQSPKVRWKTSYVRTKKWPDFLVGYEMENQPNLLGEPAVWITLKSKPIEGKANAKVVMLVGLVQQIQEAMANSHASVAPVIRVIEVRNGRTPAWAKGPGYREI
jgi:hypothetical protein